MIVIFFFNIQKLNNIQITFHITLHLITTKIVVILRVQKLHRLLISLVIKQIRIFSMCQNVIIYIHDLIIKFDLYYLHKTNKNMTAAISVKIKTEVLLLSTFSLSELFKYKLELLEYELDTGRTKLVWFVISLIVFLQLKYLFYQF